MTYGSLFSGAGGFDRGMDRAGLVCRWQCEIDATARSVLARHWPDVPRHRDVRGVGDHNLEPVDVVVGGFPCQDLSVAGKRKGFEGGTRSGLFYEFARICFELRPRFLVFENVAGLLSSDDGRDFARVLRHLGDGGYFGAWRTLDARFFGVAQFRRRVFGVFARGRAGAFRAAEILAFSEGVCGHPATRGQAGAGVAKCLTASVGRGSSGNRVGNARNTNCVVGTLQGGGDRGHRLGAEEAAGGQLVAFGGGMTSGERGVAASLSAKGGTGRLDFDTETFVVSQNQRGEVAVRDVSGALPAERGSNQNPLVFNPQAGGSWAHIGLSVERTGSPNGSQIAGLLSQAGVRRLTPREYERLQGWPDDHTRYRDDGTEIADGPRYRMVGNGVAEPVAHWLGRRLKGVV